MSLNNNMKESNYNPLMFFSAILQLDIQLNGRISFLVFEYLFFYPSSRNKVQYQNPPPAFLISI